ncbi:unnamed protein product [Closterium sp. Yama58-4]|nr:unnamed protein product [Closterium sp. Yama58-4]
MRVVSWNINGLPTTFKEASSKYGSVANFFSNVLRADVLCLQVLLTIITAYDAVRTDHGRFVLLNVYVPNAGERKHGRPRLRRKMAFLRALRSECDAIRASGRHVVVVGDINISHRDIDVFHQWRVAHIYCPAELHWLEALFGSPGAPYVDLFRHFHPTAAGAFTVWDQRTDARSRNEGQRIDYAVCDTAFLPQVLACDIVRVSPKQWSDHAAVALTLSDDTSPKVLPPHPRPALSARNMRKFQEDVTQRKLTAMFVALWLYVFAYASTSVDLHPHEHRMLPQFSPFVAGVQVSPLAPMPSPPPVLVTFARYPPIVNEQWATGRPNVRVEPYSYRSWLFHFNKWSQITLSFSNIRSHLPLDLLVVEGLSQMKKFKDDPRAFTGALRKYPLSGDDAVTFQVPRDNDYYFVLVNYNAYPAMVGLAHFEVISVLYDISKGKKACKIRNRHPAPLGSSNETDDVDGKTLTNATSGFMRMPMSMNGSSAVAPRSTAELMPPADAENVTATYTSDGVALIDSDDDDDDDDYGFCTAKLPLWETRYVVLAAPKTNKPDSTWHVQVVYQPRWLAYLALVGIPFLLSLIALSIYRCQQYLQHRSDSMRQPSSLASISTDPSPLPSSSPAEHHPLLAPTDSPPLYTPLDQATAAACSDVCTASHSQAPIPDTWAVSTTTDALPDSSAPSAPPLESSSPGKAEAGMGATWRGSEVAGGSGSGVGKGGEGEDQDKNCCCVCMENPRNAVILDCGHRATCYSCGQELMRMANKRCPICRREVRDVTRIYDA